MPEYSDIQKEETFKAAVFRDFFNSSKYAYEPNIGNIDFIVTEAKTLKGNMWKRHYLWAESKKGIAEIYSMLTQLVLTVKKTYEKGEHLPPPYIACFDTSKIAFVPFHDILPIFNDNDVNWNVTPSNHTTDDFLKTKKEIEKLSKKTIIIFNFETDKDEIVNFINKNLVAGNITAKFQINKNNFVIIYGKWLDKVKKSIPIDWPLVKKSGIIDGDFFLADLLSKDNYTLKDKLFVVLMNNQYKFDKRFDDAGFSLSKEVGFNDNQKVHKEFWDKYDRPPPEEYWDYIINRRDLLVPQDIRERKGSFFTPRQWVELSQKYIADVLGENWQDEYYVWDCAAGTGNLLAGLTNKYNIWASTLDKADVDVMKDRIRNGANLLEDHVFQFDFLNDDFNKLPKGLQDIINSEAKRKKLVIYINPPYAEAMNRTDATKAKIDVNRTATEKNYVEIVGKSIRELFIQFLIRIYIGIPGCIIANFSKLKNLQSPNFENFREAFKPKLKKIFLVPAYTFDNVKGQFPIGFFIWDTKERKTFKEVKADVYDTEGNYIGKKKIYSYSGYKYLNDWLKQYIDTSEDDEDAVKENPIVMCCIGNDFQHNNYVNINFHSEIRGIGNAKGIARFIITKNNLIEACIYFTVRKVIKADWLNDREQFLFPNDYWKSDFEFQNDCFVYALFNNSIQSKYGVNQWIPYTEKEVNARNNFESNFLTDYMSGKIKFKSNELFKELNKKRGKMDFSFEAKDVLDKGKKLWKYYHSQPSANVNASLYDIREYFQGRDDGGKMNNKSGDDTYNALISELRFALKALSLKIHPKVYEYGFLVE
jgi:hypothetical protein